VIAFAIPGMLCLVSGSAALALMLRATFGAPTLGRLLGYLGGAAAAVVALVFSFRLLWELIGQLIVNFGDRRPAPPRFGWLIVGYAVWAAALLIRHLRRAAATPPPPPGSRPDEPRRLDPN